MMPPIELQPEGALSALLTPADFQQLERLRLRPDRRFAGRVRGDRVSRQKGVSIEFADFRSYAPGDDLRHLDWSILARLDRPTIRTYQDEDDLAVYIALDASASMDFGSPTKWRAAQQIAVAVGFIALAGRDSVHAVLLEDRPGRGQVHRGRASLGALTRWADAGRPVSTAGLAAALGRSLRAGATRPGMVFCITDGLDPGAPDAIRTLASRGHQVIVVQVLSPMEIDPQLEGDLRLVDAESGQTLEITAHAEALRQYRQNLERHCAAVEAAVTRTGGRFVQLTAGADSTQTATAALRRLGVIG